MVAVGEGTERLSDVQTIRIVRRVNLTSLRQSISREEAILNAFDDLEAGQFMVLRDEHNPGWVQELLEERRPVSPDEGYVVAIRTSEDNEYVLYVGKPADEIERRPCQDIPEKYLG